MINRRQLIAAAGAGLAGLALNPTLAVSAEPFGGRTLIVGETIRITSHIVLTKPIRIINCDIIFQGGVLEIPREVMNLAKGPIISDSTIRFENSINAFCV